VPRERVRIAWHGPFDAAALSRSLASFRSTVTSLGTHQAAASKRSRPARRAATVSKQEDADARSNVA
jgi:hypothetical protein